MRISRLSARYLTTASVAAVLMAGLASPAMAQDSDEAIAEEGEIIVTAQKRAQSLSDVSLSVSAVVVVASPSSGCTPATSGGTA